MLLLAQPWEQLWAASVDAAVGAMRRHIGGRVGAAVAARPKGGLGVSRAPPVLGSGLRMMFVVGQVVLLRLLLW